MTTAKTAESPVFFEAEGRRYLMIFWPGDGWRCLELTLTNPKLVTAGSSAALMPSVIETRDITASAIPPSMRGDPPPVPTSDMFFGILDENGEYGQLYTKEELRSPVGTPPVRVALTPITGPTDSNAATHR